MSGGDIPGAAASYRDGSVVVPPEERRAAMRTVAHHALDAADAKQLLEMLDILEDNDG